jgi:hypothetical protein
VQWVPSAAPLHVRRPQPWHPRPPAVASQLLPGMDRVVGDVARAQFHGQCLGRATRPHVVVEYAHAVLLTSSPADRWRETTAGPTRRQCLSPGRKPPRAATSATSGHPARGARTAARRRSRKPQPMSRGDGHSGQEEGSLSWCLLSVGLRPGAPSDLLISEHFRQVGDRHLRAAVFADRQQRQGRDRHLRAAVFADLVQEGGGRLLLRRTLNPVVLARMPWSGAPSAAMRRVPSGTRDRRSSAAGHQHGSRSR